MEKYPSIKNLRKRLENGALLCDVFSKPEFEYLYYNEWLISEKIDGTNIRVVWDATSEKILYLARTDNGHIPAILFNKLMDIFNIDKFKSSEMPSMVLYGEGNGGNIQGFKRDVNFHLFDVYCNVWLERDNVKDIATKLSIPFVNSDRMSLRKAEQIVSQGFRSAYFDCDAEGIVARPLYEFTDRRGERVICKIKTRDYKKS